MLLEIKGFKDHNLQTLLIYPKQNYLNN